MNYILFSINKSASLILYNLKYLYTQIYCNNKSYDIYKKIVNLKYGL